MSARPQGLASSGPFRGPGSSIDLHAVARRGRSLKLWVILRYFGAEGVRERLRHHIALAQQFAGREWTEAELARLNEAILTRVNDSGEIFISHTVLRGRFTLRVAIGNLQTTDRHVARVWELRQEALRSACMAS